MALSLEELLDRALGGEDEAIEHLYQRLLRYSMYLLKDHYAAEEVVQDTFEKAWRSNPPARSRSKSWIFRIAHNTAVDYIRKQKRSLTISLHRSEDPDSSPIQEYIQLKRPEEIPDQFVEMLEDVEFVRRALEHLQEPSRSCFYLKVFERLTLNDIATIHQCSTRQVQRHIEHARHELRQIYERVHRERSSNQ